MKNIFVSILGTQAFGTLNAWLSLRESYPPEKSYLLYNARTENGAVQVKEYADRFAPGRNELISVNINNPAKNDYAPDIVARLAAEAAERGERTVFNLNGGLNYLIALCMLKLSPYKPLLINSATNSALYLDTADGSIIPGARPPELPIETVLRTQGVNYEIKQGRPEFVSQALARGLKIPANSLENVVIHEKGSPARGLCFDLLWNPGNNTISHLIAPKSAKADDKALRRARAIANFVANRDKTNDSFDHNIYVVCQHPNFAEHLKRESLHKLETATIEPTALANPSGLAAKMFYATVDNWLKRKSPSGLSSVPQPPEASAIDELDDGALVVCLGTLPASTLTAIASHRPKRLILCYDFSVKAIKENIVAPLKDFVKKLGVERIDEANFAVDGNYPDRILPPAKTGARVNVNITPGSKPQGAALTLWARERGYTVWTLNTGAGRCEPIYNPLNLLPIPIRGVEPIDELKVSGKIFKEEGRTPESVLKKTPAWGDMPDFMLTALKEGKDAKFLKEPLKNKFGELKRGRNAGEWIFVSPRGSVCIPARGGYWFEDVAGLCLRRLDFRGMRIGARIKDPRREDGHLAEIDILGVLDNNPVLVSCKYRKSQEREKTTQDAKDTENTANLINRFALPVLVSLNQPQWEIFSRVLIIGWKELCQPDLLRRLIKDFARSKQTTL
ncbi:MAG: hypothetical protein K2H64_05805 [Desulfovibrio sp.]|nr:hypothetical protein [Desulfovibrio sp.]